MRCTNPLLRRLELLFAEQKASGGGGVIFGRIAAAAKQPWSVSPFRGGGRTAGREGGGLGWRSPLAFMAKGREEESRIKGEGFSEQEEEKEYKPPLKVPPAFTRSNPAAAVVVAFVRDLVGGRANFSSAIFGTA